MEVAKSILKFGKEKSFDDLEKFIGETPVKVIIEAAKLKITSPDAYLFWNYVLMGCDNMAIGAEKRFQIVMAVLQLLNKIEVPYKRTFELVTRLFIDLSKFSSSDLIEFTEYCIDSIKAGDPKCIGWKDLLPEVMMVLSGTPHLLVNGIEMTGMEYREQCVKNLFTMKWPSSILTPLMMMFKEMPNTKEENLIILTKICESLHQLEPAALPPLANQMFTFCETSAVVIIPILSFQKYFFKNYYKKLFEDLDSDVTDYNSIDIELYSEAEMRQAEETILYHLGKCTEDCITEREITNSCRDLSATPQYILTPFIISSLLSMSNTNRYPDFSRLSSSSILPFLRNVIKNNEAEKELCLESAWCRHALDRKTINMQRIFDILIDQNKEGMDTITPGLVSLAFTLLKSPNTQLHSISMQFLEQFIKKRYIFCQGIFEKVTQFLFADLDSVQYSECITRLSVVNSITVTNYCMDSIKNILNHIPLISGHQAMKMMTFMGPLIKVSEKVRDLFIDVLCKAMYKRDVSTRQMAVYGFCLILKQLRNNNARRTVVNSGRESSQFSISGYSLMSPVVSSTNNPQRHFDMSVLEIIGMLRKCNNQMYEIKQTLYDGLTKAINFNPKLTPHVLQFLELNFQNYFQIDDLNCSIKFDLLIREKNDVIEVWDDLGRLMQVIGLCIITCEQNEFQNDFTMIKKLMESLMNRIETVSLEQLGLIGALDHKMNYICCQYLNCVEALMHYAIWGTTKDNNYLSKLLKLFKHHTETMESIKASNISKKFKKGKKRNENDDADGTSQASTHTSSTTSVPNHLKPVLFHPENIWELNTLERFLRVIYDDIVSFATTDQTSAIRSNRNLSRYVLQVTSVKIENLRKLPEHRQVKYSKSAFLHLCQVTQIIFEKCIKNLANLWENFDVISAQQSVESFRQCLLTMDTLYSRKSNEFLLKISHNALLSKDENILIIVNVLEGLLEKLLLEEYSSSDVDMYKIPNLLLQCLEILYKYIQGPDDAQPISDSEPIKKTYNWLYKFCTDNEIDGRNMDYVHCLLFKQRMKIDYGIFFNSISLQIADLAGYIHEKSDVEMSQFTLKSITLITMNSTILHLCATLKRQIESIEYFIVKAKSFHAKLKIGGQGKSEQCVYMMKTTEMKICTQLINIGNVVVHLTNCRIPLGQCMDSLLRLLIQYYICLSNITKHFILRHGTLAVSYQGTRFDQLVRRAGRSLASRVYGLITYIEENIFEGKNRRKIDARLDKAKVIRETKFLPKLILRIESFNKFVLCLGKKTKIDLSQNLHTGTVRDFRIKTSELRDVLNKTIEESLYIEVDESEMDVAEVNDLDEDEDENVDEPEAEIDVEPPTPSTSQTSTNSYTIIQDKPSTAIDVTRHDIALKNLEKINQNIKRKERLKESVDEDQDDDEDDDDKVGGSSVIIPVKKRKRSKPVVKLNKKSLLKKTKKKE